MKIEQFFRFRVSAAYRLFSEQLSDEQNSEMYGDDWAKECIGQNFEVSIGLGRSIEKSEKDQAIKFIKNKIDHQMLNDVDVFFRSKPVSLENISRFIYDLLHSQNINCHIVVLKDGGGSEVSFNGRGYIISKRYKINALHRHHNKSLSMEENVKLFDKCAHTHGHEYKIDLRLSSPSLNEYGVVLPRKRMDEEVKNNISNAFHGKYINEVMGNTSGELILVELGRRLESRFADELGLAISLHETKKNSFFTV